MAFQPHPLADRRRRSAAALIKQLLSIKSSEVLPEHVRELIDCLLWKITEADGKTNTRFKTSGALGCTDNKLLRHEHVYQKNKMIDALVKCAPGAVDGVLVEAVGCLVTVDEHLRLNKFDSDYGWE